MPKISFKVIDVAGFDGTYIWDMSEREFTGHELHLIKTVAGVRLGEFEEALAAGDYDLIVALAAIMIWRTGKVERNQAPALVDMLLEAEGGKIQTAKVDEPEAVEDPPAVALPEPVSSSAGNESSVPSSEGSNSTGDDPQVLSLRAIGSQG